VTDEDWALYRKRQLEIHEERGRERQLRHDANLLAAAKLAKDLRKLNRK
jgi:hypothetical protein